MSDITTRKNTNSKQIVESILTAISKAESFDDLAKRIVTTCAEEFDAEICTLWRRYTDEDGIDRLRLAAASAKEPQTLAQEVIYEIRSDPEGKNADGVTGYVAQTGREVHVRSFTELQEKYGFCWKGKIDGIQWASHPDKSFKSLYAVPLTLGFKIVGVLKLENKHDSTNGFPESDRIMLHQIVPYIATAVHSLILLDPHERRLIEAPALLAEALLRPFETHELMQQIVEKTAEILHAEICTLWLVNPDRTELRVEAYYGFEKPQEFPTYKLNWDAEKDNEIEGITAYVAIRKKSFWANSWPELRAHDSWKGKWDTSMWQDNKAFRCLYAVPLLRENEVKGVMKVENRIGAASFTETDKVLFNIMASFIVLVLELGQQFRASMVSDFAHIIRSPIGQVVMNLSGLKRELQKTASNQDKVNRYIDLIKKAMLAINITSKTLSTFTVSERLTAQKELPTESVSVQKLIQRRIDDTKPLIPEKMQITTIANLDNDYLDLNNIEQTNFNIVFDNILHNAIKFSPPDGLIEIIINQMNDNVMLVIRDHGSGISQEDLPHVFDSGFSKRATGHPDSAGMGLFTVSKLLKRLGWSYTIESVEGEGTTFKMFIPCTGEGGNNQ